jgi:preprotein translocase subunit SecA
LVKASIGLVLAISLYFLIAVIILNRNSKFETIKTLQIIEFEFENQEAQMAELERMKAELEELNANVELQHDSVLNPQDPQEKIEPIKSTKVPRNAPCPCGSGKKYKQCCGKSGPKKGILAK